LNDKNRGEVDEPFYMSIMFIGIVLIAVSLFWILLDRKQAFDYSKGIKESKAELF
jgi:hypothetical protein